MPLKQDANGNNDPQSPHEQIARLASRLAQLEAERDILDTIHRYGHSIDYGYEEEWLDCFLPEAEYDLRWPGPDGALVQCRGRNALTEFFVAHTHAPTHWQKHLLSLPRISLAPDGCRASAETYVLRVDHWKDERDITAFGRYKDELVLCDDGRWRFSRRLIELESIDEAMADVNGIDA